MGDTGAIMIMFIGFVDMGVACIAGAFGYLFYGASEGVIYTN